MCSKLGSFSSNLLQSSRWLIDSKRTAFVLRRTRPIRLNKLGATSKKKLKRPFFYYEVAENTDLMKKPFLNLVLTKDVPGVGMLGEKIQANYYVGYRDLLLPKLAVYADSPEAQGIVRSEEEVQYSSVYSKIVENYLADQLLPICMSSETEWTLQPWHVKFSLRKKGLLVNDDCIILPEKKISGPNKDLENRDFIVKLIMNKTEKFLIRCRIYHWSGDIDLSSRSAEQWYLTSEPLFEEDKEIVENLKKIGEQIKKKKMLAASKGFSNQSPKSRGLK